MDTLVFDIETSNFFTDVGWNNWAALKVSVVGVYSYLQDKYFCFDEKQLAAAADLFAGAREIIGFSSNHYDIPVLNLHFQTLPNALNLWHKQRFDLAERLEDLTGRRIGLSRLAEANLGEKKDRHSSEAITLYKEGRMAELKEYCLKDVRLTRALYDLVVRQGYLMIPERGGAVLTRVDFGPAEIKPPIGLGDAQTANLL